MINNLTKDNLQIVNKIVEYENTNITEFGINNKENKKLICSLRQSIKPIFDYYNSKIKLDKTII